MHPGGMPAPCTEGGKMRTNVYSLMSGRLSRPKASPAVGR